MSSRSKRALIAAETIAITDAGTYLAPSGRENVVRDAIARAADASVLVSPAEFVELRATANRKLSDLSHRTAFGVANETTFAAARRLAAEVGGHRTAALNFASAKNPGGGFLSGAQAQEECLARASALYACLQRHMPYYEANRRCESLLYTDHMIVAPRVTVFRDDDDQLLEEPWETTIITSPAPNAGAIAKNDPPSIDLIEPTFRRRIEMVLSAAVAFDQTAIVLGAWGCGVFGNDPAMVARLFAEFLLGDGRFAHAFAHVAFAVLDRKGDTIAPFAGAFAGNSP
jgi:uncharacterized protein (TIGR02452 family)